MSDESAKIKFMLIPRFTLRWMLMATAAMALLAWVVALAVRGHTAAIAFCAAIGTGVLMFLLYAIVFVVAFAVARSISQRRSTGDGQNPFSTPQPALPPRVE